MQCIKIPRLEPSEESEGINAVVLNYDETLLGAEYEVIAVDLNRRYDDAVEKEK